MPLASMRLPETPWISKWKIRRSSSSHTVHTRTFRTLIRHPTQIATVSVFSIKPCEPSFSCLTLALWKSLAIRDPRILASSPPQKPLHFRTRFSPCRQRSLLLRDRVTCMHMHIAALQLEQDESAAEPASPVEVARPGVLACFMRLSSPGRPQARRAKRMLSFRESKGTQS
jgi:hypothetical protein